MPPSATHMSPVDANACFGGQNANQLVTGKTHLAVFVKHIIRCQQSCSSLRRQTRVGIITSEAFWCL